jgi:hypothetical protein
LSTLLDGQATPTPTDQTIGKVEKALVVAGLMQGLDHSHCLLRRIADQDQLSLWELAAEQQTTGDGVTAGDVTAPEAQIDQQQGSGVGADRQIQIQQPLEKRSLNKS